MLFYPHCPAKGGGSIPMSGIQMICMYDMLTHKTTIGPGESRALFYWSFRADPHLIRPRAASRFAISMSHPFHCDFTQMHIQFLEIQLTSLAPSFNLPSQIVIQLKSGHTPKNQSQSNHNHTCAHLGLLKQFLLLVNHFPSKQIMTKVSKYQTTHPKLT